MQFRDLKRQYEVLQKDIDVAMLEVARTGTYIMGSQVKKLEERLAKFVGVKHCVTCGNGTDALTLALKVWGIGKGDAVFVPDFTFFASAEAVALEGAVPIFVDVDKDTCNIDPVDLENNIEKTIKEGMYIPKVVIAVDLFGLPANYPVIRKIADQYNLLVLEDGAQGFGGAINELVVLVTYQRRLFFLLNLLDAMEMGAQYSRTMMNGQNWQIPTEFTVRELSNMIMLG